MNSVFTQTNRAHRESSISGCCRYTRQSPALTGNPGEFVICGICVRRSGTEQHRLIDQAEALEPQARWLLDRLRVEAGWRVADIGCGPVGILHLLSERVGAEGDVVGIEREQRFANLARREIEKRRLKNVTIVQGDALGPSETSEQFDSYMSGLSY
jgi:SAM-dependent methyltransferase